MTERETKPPLWLIPSASTSLPNLRKRHPWLAYVVLGAALVGLLPAFLFLAPRTVWEPEAVFVLLLSAGFVSAASSIEVRTTVLVDSGSVPALLGVALFGPLAGACIFAAGELIYLFRQHRPGHQPLALMTNLAMCGWACIAAGCFLAALGFGPPLDGSNPWAYVLIVVASMLMTIVNVIFLTISGVLYDGAKTSVVLSKTLKPVVIADTGLALAAAITLGSYTAFGVVGLLPLAAVILLPRLMARTFYSRPVHKLAYPAAVTYYSDLLAEILGLDRTQRHILSDAAAQVSGEARLQRVDHFDEVMQAVLYANERWDGAAGGFPQLLAGEKIPIESRILAVARAWAELTAHGTRELEPQQALVDLRARAGGEFDPTVVAAAVRAVEDELLPGPAATTALVGQLSPSS